MITYQEVMTYLMAGFTFVLAAIRVLCFPDGKVLRRYTVGSSMTIGDRQVQEDQIGVCQSAEGLLAVLADGMGRNYGGKIAGRIAVDTMKQLFMEYRSFVNPVYFFRKAFRAANHEILKELANKNGGASLGAVVLQDGHLYYALAGNVKIAVYRKGSLIPISTGHTIDRLAEETYRQGTITREDAVRLLHNKRTYHYLGQDSFQELEYFDTPVRLRPRDLVVLMSDGVYEGIAWKEIEECLFRRKSCQDKAYEIIERINTGGRKDKDNASILLIEQP